MTQISESTVLSTSLEALNRRFDSMVGLERTPRTPWDVASSYRVLTIVGGRGSGKTTLLSQFTKKISERDDIVALPPLQPEMFTPIDTIFSVLIAKLRGLLSASAGEAALGLTRLEIPTLRTDYNLGQALDRLLRGSAVVHDSAGIQATAQSSLSQFSSEFVTHALAGEEFTELLDATIRASCQVLAPNSSKVPMLVVPIDDPDLAPALLSSILRDIRTLAKAPDVLVCVGLDLDETRRVLAADYIKGLGIQIPTQGAFSIVEAQLSKALPAQLRVSLAELSQTERLAFTPLGFDRPSIVELLSAVTMPTPQGDFKVSDLFYLQSDEGATEPTPYSECLPSNPRALEHLHHQLYALVSEEGLVDAAEVGWLLSDTAVRHGFHRTPYSELEPERLLKMEQSPYEEEQPRIFIDFDPISYQRKLRYPPITLNTAAVDSGLEIILGTLGFPHGALEKEDAAENRTGAVDDSLILGLLLAREFTMYGEAFIEEVSGGEPIIGGKQNSLLNCRFGPDRADSFFLVLPRWRTYYDYFVFDQAWHESLMRTHRHAHNFDVDPPELVAGLVVAFIRMTAEIHSNRRPSPLDPESIAGLCGRSERTEALRDQWVGVRELVEGLAGEASSASPRDSLFTKWIANYLPMTCHPWLLPRWLIEEILDLRHAVCRALRIPNFELRHELHRRIRQALGDEWITPLFEIFETVPELELDSVWPLHESAVRLRETERQRVVKVPTFAYREMPAPELARQSVAVLREMIAEEEREIEDN